MGNIKNYLLKYIFEIVLLAITLFMFVVNVKINAFRYDNFDYGKFDLGNMTQMVWNASHGNGLRLTDYFGTNLPRWAMSHVDPILYLFVPLFIIFPNPMTLVISQLFLVIFSSVLIYLVAKTMLKSKGSAFLLSLSYLFNPSIGYITALTAFHGVTVAIPFFLLSFYVYERMYRSNTYSRKNLFLFFTMVLVTMSGKEQIPLYFLGFGIFILVLRNNNSKTFKQLLSTINFKLGIILILLSLFWFITAFFL